MIPAPPAALLTWRAMLQANHAEARAFAVSYARLAGLVDVSTWGNPPAVCRRPVPESVLANGLRLMLWAADLEAGLR